MKHHPKMGRPPGIPKGRALLPSLLTIRSLRGVSMRALSEECGVPVRTLYKWEKCQVSAPKDALPALAAALRCEVDEMMRELG